MSEKKKKKKADPQYDKIRAHPRFDVSNLTGSIFFSMDANVINLSIDGASIETTKRLGLGNEYIIKVMHNERLIELKGKTVWCTLNRYVKNELGDVIPIYRAGIMFTDLFNEKVQELLTFIRDNRIETMEKRILGRFNLTSPQSFVKIDYPQEFIVKTISLSGMSIESDIPIKPETLFNLDIQLNDAIYNFKGKVTKLDEIVESENKSYLLDIEFLEMNDSDREVLSSYISNLSK